MKEWKLGGIAGSNDYHWQWPAFHYSYFNASEGEQPILLEHKTCV